MSKHLKLDDKHTVCGIALDVLDYKIAEIVEIPEDADCPWCLKITSERTQDLSQASPHDNQIDEHLAELLSWFTDGENPTIAQYKAVAEAKAKLHHLVNEAIVDELNNYRDYWHNLGFRGDAMDDLDRRIAELKGVRVTAPTPREAKK